jgi:micrococcal nuclease
MRYTVRMNRRSVGVFIAALLLGILSAAGYLTPREATMTLDLVSQTVGRETSTNTATSTSSARIIRIIDGDTVITDTGEHIRYIGIDSPEIGRNGARSECFATEAAAYNAKLVLGRNVRLIADIEDRDRFGRMLRYVEIDGVNISVHLVEEGYAKRLYVPPNGMFQTEIRSAETRSKNLGRGIWSACE